MEQVVRVRELLPNGMALVVRTRESACSGECHKCAGCGSKEQIMLLQAVNAIGAKVGDAVILRSESKPVLKAAAVVYLIPLILFFIGYAAGQHLGQQGSLLGCAGFAAGLVLATRYDRRVGKKKETVYTIVRFSGEKQ